MALSAGRQQTPVLHGILRTPNSASSPNVIRGRRRAGDQMLPSSATEAKLARRPSEGGGVHFAPPEGFSDLLRRYLLSGDGDRVAVEQLDGMMTHLRNQRGAGLAKWLAVLQANVALLKPSRETFVAELLKVSWVEEDAADAFAHFLTDLISAHSFYTRHVMHMLVRHFVQPNLSEEGEAKVHQTIRSLLATAPMAARRSLLKVSADCLPYELTPDVTQHTGYLRNVAKMLEYLKDYDDRLAIWRILIGRLVQLDAHLPKLLECEDDSEDDEEDQEGEGIVFSMDQQISKKPSDSAIAKRNLDQGMVVMFRVLRSQYHGGAKVFRELLVVFESHVLPAYATGHVQFLMFYLMNLDKSAADGVLTSTFFDYLWSKFRDPNTPGILRQAAAAYSGSLASRGLFVDLATAKTCMERLVSWAHAYLKNTTAGRDFYFVDLKAHGPFYAACQAALYVFAFRHEEFFADEKMVAFLRSLNLSTLVTSHLNPLRVCLTPVVRNFAAVARRYQLVYCDSIVERNNRINLPVVGSLSSTSFEGKPLLLDSFFPFDPYSLPESKVFVEESYRFYKEDDEDDDDSDNEEEMDLQETAGPQSDRDDLMSELVGSPQQLLRTKHDKMAEFLYGTSPGFKSKSPT